MKKIVVFISIFFIIISICINSYGKYIFSDVKIVANINIEGKPPEIEFISVSNTNQGYEKYANSSHIITVNFRVKEKNVKEDNIKNEAIYLLGDNVIEPLRVDKKRSVSGEYINYTFKLYEIGGNGELKIKIPKGSVIDEGNRVNEEVIFNTGIQIDNVAPAVSFIQENINGGIVNAKLKANELIRPVEAWNLSQDNMELSKQFECNVSYPLPVTDYAGNISNIDVKISKATKIQILFAGTNKPFIWETTEGLGETIGKEMLEENRKEKLEAFGYHWNGIDKDFIQIRIYEYTPWEEGSYQVWGAYETPFYSGYNPPDGSYASMLKGRGGPINGQGALFLGGVLENSGLSQEIAKQNIYGLSALTFKLKDYSYYSIVYQIWVEGKGWLEPVSDGVETTAGLNKPFGAYRVELIPKSEKQYLINDWKKDVGTNNL